MFGKTPKIEVVVFGFSIFTNVFFLISSIWIAFSSFCLCSSCGGDGFECWILMNGFLAQLMIVFSELLIQFEKHLNWVGNNWDHLMQGQWKMLMEIHECRKHLWMCDVLLKISSHFPLGCTFPARTLPVFILLLQAPQYLLYFCWNAAEKRNIWQVTKPEWQGKAEKSLREGATSVW